MSTIYPHDINLLIDKLRANASPGVDGITAEHIKNGKCTILSQLLSSCIVLLSLLHVYHLHFVMVLLYLFKKNQPSIPTKLKTIDL